MNNINCTHCAQSTGRKVRRERQIAEGITEMPQEHTKHTRTRRSKATHRGKAVSSTVDDVGIGGEVRTGSGVPQSREPSQVVQNTVEETESEVIVSSVESAKRKIAFETGNGIPQAQSTPYPQTVPRDMDLSEVQDVASTSLTRRPLWKQNDEDLEETTTGGDTEQTDSGSTVEGPHPPAWMNLSMSEFLSIAVFALFSITLFWYAITHYQE